MTNYEKLIEEMSQDKFVMMMSSNCFYCPVLECKHRYEITTTIRECLETLEEWCKQEVNP